MVQILWAINCRSLLPESRTSREREQRENVKPGTQQCTVSRPGRPAGPWFGTGFKERGWRSAPFEGAVELEWGDDAGSGFLFRGSFTARS